MYKWKKKPSAFIFPWRSTNINVQVNNSYKRNLKEININEHCIVFTICIDRLMLIKAITLFRLRAVSDFLFVFCSLLTLMKHQSVTKTKYWHTIFSQLFSFTLRHKLCLSEYSPSQVIVSQGDATGLYAYFSFRSACAPKKIGARSKM